VYFRGFSFLTPIFLQSGSVIVRKIYIKEKNKMSDRARNILNTGNKMLFFGRANQDLATRLPLSAIEFTTLESLVGQLEAAGVSRFSARSAGKSETRTKAAIYDSLDARARAIAGTALILKKKIPNFDNRFTLERDRLSYTDLIQRTKAMYADSEANEQAFTDYGLDETFRADLKADYTALESGTQRQADAKTESVGDTAQIDDVCDQILDVRDTLNRMLKNVYRNNPEKLAEWKSAAHIETRAPRDDEEPEENEPPTT
jgi:hypothetical protein